MEIWRRDIGYVENWEVDLDIWIFGSSGSRVIVRMGDWEIGIGGEMIWEIGRGGYVNIWRLL